ncbi:dead deah box helicase domain-containing protein [Cystoisospora suis]|uniref:ATP-dependent RNA helicase n=1 Tax=Cystoisospora suis TaxID=483139 RepID=A0A2C6KG85_9APIC|nr:dead deah box helicase domain-containing protein [Cystoisospora suis]
MRENEEMEEEDQDEVLQSLHPCLVDRLRRTMNIHSLFPVQRKVIGLLKRAIDHPFDPRNCDICVSAPTGEGKTFCYVLPIVDFLLKSVVRTTRCLVITPTRELAIQVAEEFGRFHHYPCPRSLRSVSPHSPSPASSSFMDSHSTACKRKSSDTAPLHHSFCETEGEEEEKMKRKKKKKKRRRDREVDEEERRTDSVEEENGEERISRCRKGETRRDEEDEENNPTSTTTAEETEPDTERDEEEEDESKRRDEEEEREENKVKQKKKKTPGCVEEDCNMKRPRFDPGVISSLQPYHRDFSPPCRGEITVACLVGELTNTTPMISPSSSHPKKSSSSSSSFLGWSSHARSPSSFFSPNGFCLPTPHMNLHTSTLSPSFSSSCSSSPPPDVIVCTPGKFTELVENEIKKSSSLRHSPSEEKAGKGQLATCMRRSRRDTFSGTDGCISPVASRLL